MAKINENVKVMMLKGDKGNPPTTEEIQMGVETWAESYPTSLQTIIETNTNSKVNEYLTNNPVVVNEVINSLLNNSTFLNSVTSNAKLSCYPVGSVYTSLESTDPTSLFGGTWERIAEGRMLVGIGTGEQEDGMIKIFSEGETGGEYFHELTIDEMPKHTHSLGTTNQPNILTYNGIMSTRQGIVSSDTSANYNYLRIGTGGTIYHISDTGSTGTGAMHNNMPPYLPVYMWQRIA